jgi:N6-L-threonylcarbamoyladenine synthase
MKVLAIESSCDDTSFAVVNDDKTVDFHETINHRKFHREHGGVVPEMAARQHLDIMDYLSKFQKKINFNTIDAIASTYGPGTYWRTDCWVFFCERIGALTAKKNRAHQSSPSSFVIPSSCFPTVISLLMFARLWGQYSSSSC